MAESSERSASAVAEAFEHGAADPAATPQIARVDIPAAAVFDETFSVGLGEPFDLAQPEAQRPPASGNASPPRAGSGSLRENGSSVQSHSLKLISTGRTSTPCSRASRTIWAGA